MSEISNLVNTDWRNGLIFVAIIIVAFIWIISKFDWIVGRFGLVTKAQLKREKQEEDIQKLKDFAKNDEEALQKLQEHANRSDEGMQELRIHAQQTDKNINTLIDCMKDMKNSVDIIAGQVSDVQKHNADMIQYRQEREAKEAAEFNRLLEENKNRDKLSLGMARSMLLDNYDKCVAKNSYTYTERDVYHKLYEAYVEAGGNSCIMDLAKEIVKLPFDDGER